MSNPPTGTFPTPYGIEVPIYSSNDPGDKEAFCFDLDGTMTMAGLHGMAVRASCRADLLARIGQAGEMPLSIVFRHGGRPVPRVPLAPVQTEDSAYRDIPVEFGVRELVDNWVTRVTDLHRWCDRSRDLLELTAGNVEHFAGSLPDDMIGFVIGLVITATLENLGESEIDCIEAASWYALSAHPQWRSAAVEWITPFRSTWWRDWRATRPAYRRFAGMVLELHDDLPRWLAGEDAR